MIIEKFQNKTARDIFKIIKISFLFLFCVLAVYIFQNCSSSSTEPDDDEPIPDVTPQFSIIGYLPDYRIETTPEYIAAKLTDLIYFSIEPGSDGELDLSRITTQTLNTLKRFREQNPNLRISIAVGGWERSAGFATMSTNSQYRNNFIRNILNFCMNYEFDGVDYDWEFPSNIAQSAGYDSLIVNTKKAFSEHNLIVSVALNSYQKLGLLSYQYLDRVHVMSYDHSGQHSTYNQAVADVNIFLNQGVASNKICLGVPFYGRKTQDFSQALTYAQIVSQFNPSAETDEIEGYYFNGKTTIGKKAWFVKTNQYNGIMIWELGQDAYDEHSLLTAIYEVAVENADSAKYAF